MLPYLKALCLAAATLRGSKGHCALEESEMQSENKLFDDFVKMVNGVAGTFAGMGREAEASAREKFREWMAGTDFVGRDEFEAVKAMAAKAREENEELKKQIAELQAKLAGPQS